MKATFTFLGSAIEKALNIITLLSLLFWIHPALVHASSIQDPGVNSALVFNIEQKPNSAELDLPVYLSTEEAIKNDPLTKKVEKYLEDKGSPLAPYAWQIVQLPQWEQALGITYVESNFCKVANGYNCGSIGVGPGHPAWRRYPTAFEGFKDLTTLLEKPIYKERFTTCKSKLRVYVVPGSQRWLNGCESVSQQMFKFAQEANHDRIALANSFTVSTATNELALVK